MPANSLILDVPDLNTTSKFIFLALTTLATGNEISGFTVDELADITGVSIQTFFKHMEILENQHLVSIIRQQNKRNIYHIDPNFLLELDHG